MHRPPITKDYQLSRYISIRPILNHIQSLRHRVREDPELFFSPEISATAYFSICLVGDSLASLRLASSFSTLNRFHCLIRDQGPSNQGHGTLRMPWSGMYKQNQKPVGKKRNIQQNATHGSIGNDLPHSLDGQSEPEYAIADFDSLCVVFPLSLLRLATELPTGYQPSLDYQIFPTLGLKQIQMIAPNLGE